MYFTLILHLLISFASSQARILSSCGLVREMDDFRNSSYTAISYSDFPLVVCIAGYRKYDTAHRLSYTNGTGYYGIFGVHFPKDVPKCWISGIGDNWGGVTTGELLSNILQADFRCMKNVLLKDDLVLKFYKRMCGPKMVRKVNCQLNLYRSIEVWDPIYKDIFDTEFLTNKEDGSLFDVEETLTRSTTENPTQGTDKNPKFLALKVTKTYDDAGITTIQDSTFVTESEDYTTSTVLPEITVKSSTARTESTSEVHPTVMIVVVTTFVQLLVLGAVVFLILRVVHSRRSPDPQIALQTQ